VRGVAEEAGVSRVPDVDVVESRFILHTRARVRAPGDVATRGSTWSCAQSYTGLRLDHA
jgi:hypothetical protein